MLTLMLIMLGAGIVGGVVNVTLNETERTRFVFGASILSGIAAAFLMPLFLYTVKSSLIADLKPQESAEQSYLIFGGFCLLAAISSRTFIQSLSSKVLHEVKEAKRVSQDAHRESARATDVAESAHLLAEVAQDSAIYDLGSGKYVSQKTNRPMGAGGHKVAPGGNLDDPRAGQFGGNSVSGNREIVAEIRRDAHRPEWRIVTLKVRSTDEKPLEGQVTFFLHPSFRNSTPVVPVLNGEASLTLATWGAFTAGAVADEGTTKLEINLAKHPDADEPWKSR